MKKSVAAIVMLLIMLPMLLGGCCIIRGVPAQVNNTLATFVR